MLLNRAKSRVGDNVPFRRKSGRRIERLERREVMDASLQVIHNSPYAAAALVDVYVNDQLLLNDFAFRTATPFVNVPSGVNLKIDIAAADAPNNLAPVFTTNATLADGATYVAIAAGDPLAPGGPTAFNLAVSGAGRQASTTPGNAEFLVFHGAPDAPAVDVVARGIGTLINDISFPTFAADYLSVAPANYTIDVTLSDGSTRVRSFAADLSGAGGAAFVVAASGFVAPQAGQPEFGLLAVFADGTTALLPEVKPVFSGTNRSDDFTVRANPTKPGVFDVVRGFEVTSLLAITNSTITIEGGRGADTLRVRYPNGSVTLPSIRFDGGAGNDRVLVYGSGEDDRIHLIENAAFAVNVPANTISLSNIESLTVWAGNGNDEIDASGLRRLRATIYGESGNDYLVGGEARDTIYGGWGNDRIAGNGGNDALFGQWGDDILFGGAGRNRLVGGFGKDTISELAEWLAVATRR